jgi:predicted nucleic acid-binding protein
LRFLVDTVVLSETRKAQPDRNVAAWLSSIAPSALFVSVVTAAEIQRGITLIRARDPQFARELDRWIVELLVDYADRLITMDSIIARRWGELSALMGNRDPDLAIAATALEHSLVVATRNTSDFLPAGVPVLNPFEPNPAVVRP